MHVVHRDIAADTKQTPHLRNVDVQYDVKAVKFETAPHRNEVHLHQTRAAIDFGAVWD